MIDTEDVTKATENLRLAIQESESKLKIMVTQEGTIHPDCFIQIVGELKSEVLSMKCDVILARAVIFAQDQVLSGMDKEAAEALSHHTTGYLDTASDRIREDAKKREESKSKIIQPSLPF
jgi:hypothetical protein